MLNVICQYSGYGECVRIVQWRYVIGSVPLLVVRVKSLSMPASMVEMILSPPRRRRLGCNIALSNGPQLIAYIVHLGPSVLMAPADSSYGYRGSAIVQ
jgi:hypothetical protein